MSNRTTKAMLEARVENLNRRMESRGSIYRYQVQGRNGYTALDRFYRDPDATINLPDSVPGRGYGWRCQDTVWAGTKGEISDLLRAMMIALDDAATTS